ncbi:hypothetical protein VNO80_02753 [Phaseolus coccineus]|uniref:MI domain-containing protein n=1 Tax=Phaseolus coccineus TaxID=3886 RepID=A0AAN9RI78_PHACN
MVKGFSRLEEVLDDLILDIPSTKTQFQTMVSKAISKGFFDSLFFRPSTRAVIDDVLAPLNLEEMNRRLNPDSSGNAKDKIMKLLEEYESGGVVSEACQSIRELEMPFFNHKVVKKALVMAMEKKNDRMLDLLHECFSEGLITINQMTKGFTRMKDSLNDLALDIPKANEKFSLYLDHALKKSWLLPSFDSSVTNV